MIAAGVPLSTSNPPVALRARPARNMPIGLAAVTSLRSRYVDGDDATSIAYHAFGRDAAAHEAYAPYHAGADLLLSGLGTDEAVLRTTAMALSSVATVITVGLMVRPETMPLIVDNTPGGDRPFSGEIELITIGLAGQVE